MKNHKLSILFICMFLLGSCGFVSVNPQQLDGDYEINDIRIYANTPAWELAQAVVSQKTRTIKRIGSASPELLNYQDPKYGSTLLYWSVAMEKYKSAESLLEAGADPDIISTYEGGTALYRAANFSYVDSFAKKDAKYVELLLKYDADPNIGFVGNDHNNTTEMGETPLMHSIGCGIEKTKALVEGGADINFSTPSGRTAAIKSLLAGKFDTAMTATREYAYYLIVEKKADVTKPYQSLYNENKVIEYWPIDSLRQGWNTKPNTEDHRMKLAIIDEFARQGVIY